jgi:hypothetical protein
MADRLFDFSNSVLDSMESEDADFKIFVVAFLAAVRGVLLLDVRFKSCTKRGPGLYACNFEYPEGPSPIDIMRATQEAGRWVETPRAQLAGMEGNPTGSTALFHFAPAKRRRN